MKFTQPLMRKKPTNFLRMMRSQWVSRTRTKIIDTCMRRVLGEHNIPVYEAADVLNEKPEIEKFEVIGMYDKEIPQKEGHPLWHDVPCLTYKDHNVLVEGLKQAKLLTNTVEVKEGLPSELEVLSDKVYHADHDDMVKKCIMNSIVYDGTQVKLPVVKDPKRPAWNFPRTFGISDTRKNLLLSNKLLQLSEMIAGSIVSENRMKFDDAFFSVPLLREDTLQLQLRADTFVLSNKPLKPYGDVESTRNIQLEDLHPLKYTVSLDRTKLYELKNLYPIKQNTEFTQPHTAIIYFNETEVKNLYGTPVLETQVMARSLMKAFTVAAAKARTLYGDDVLELPTPITVQLIHTDSRSFHFGVFQLNSLVWPIEPTQNRNIFWHLPPLELYGFCGYHDAKPALTDYNPDVFKLFLAFYVNGSNVNASIE